MEWMKKFQKGSEMWAMFVEYWDLVQKYWNVEGLHDSGLCSVLAQIPCKLRCGPCGGVY